MRYMSMWGFCAVVALIGVCAVASSPASAQQSEQRGSIVGTVKDTEGKRVAGVQLRLERTEEGDRKATVAKATTDEDGNFEMKDLPPGEYTLIAGNKQMGWIYMEVQVNAGEETNVEELTLAK